MKRGWSWQGWLGNPMERQRPPWDTVLVAVMGPQGSLPV